MDITQIVPDGLSTSPREYSPLALAFIGDAVYEVFVRARVLAEANTSANTLHKKAIAYVKAAAQARAAKALLDTFFTALHVPAELIAPFVEARHQRGIGALHMNEHDVVYGVSVKAAHGDKVIPVFIALEQLFDALLNTGCDFFDTVFV